eukprot:31494-Pelagococcus_subviridis.AAC.13
MLPSLRSVSSQKHCTSVSIASVNATTNAENIAAANAAANNPGNNELFKSSCATRKLTCKSIATQLTVAPMVSKHPHTSTDREASKHKSTSGPWRILRCSWYRAARFNATPWSAIWHTAPGWYASASFPGFHAPLPPFRLRCVTYKNSSFVGQLKGTHAIELRAARELLRRVQKDPGREHRERAGVKRQRPVQRGVKRRLAAPLVPRLFAPKPRADVHRDDAAHAEHDEQDPPRRADDDERAEDSSPEGSNAPEDAVDDVHRRGILIVLRPHRLGRERGEVHERGAEEGHDGDERDRRRRHDGHHELGHRDVQRFPLDEQHAHEEHRDEQEHRPEERPRGVQVLAVRETRVDVVLRDVVDGFARRQRRRRQAHAQPPEYRHRDAADARDDRERERVALEHEREHVRDDEGDHDAEHDGVSRREHVAYGHVAHEPLQGVHRLRRDLKGGVDRSLSRRRGLRLLRHLRRDTRVERGGVIERGLDPDAAGAVGRGRRRREQRPCGSRSLCPIIVIRPIVVVGFFFEQPPPTKPPPTARDDALPAADAHLLPDRRALLHADRVPVAPGRVVRMPEVPRPAHAFAGAAQRALRVVPYKATSGWSSKASEAESKGVAVCRD